MTYKIAMAAAHDAGNRHAKKHGRMVWDETDYAEAARVFQELWGQA